MRVRNIEIGDEVADILRRGSWDGSLFRLPPGQLDRKVYESVDKVLRALGGKWHKGQRGHQFESAAQAELVAALDSGSVVDRKRTLELFETPVEIAKRMAQMAAAISDQHDGNIRVLEPSAGRGRLLAAFAENLDTNGLDQVFAFDIDAANCHTLTEQGVATQVVCGDFLAMNPCPSHQADVILMNPPFAQCADIAHVRHAFERWLAAGGVLVAIMSPHWVFATDRPSNDFRAMLSHLGDDAYDWEPLPEGSFRSEGTGVNVGILTIRKRA